MSSHPGTPSLPISDRTPRRAVHLDAPDPFITYVVGSEHHQRRRRAADERRARRSFRRRRPEPLES